MELQQGRPASCEGRLDKEIRVYDFLDKLLGNFGELGLYSWGVHVGICETKKRFRG